jgi:hypothetical protein
MIALTENAHEQFLPIDLIRPSPENAQVYRPVTPTDPEIIALAASIRADGVQEPLIVTADHFIISGHRRRTAASMAGLTSLPCVVKPIYKDIDHDEFMRLLISCNKQRLKSADELLREAVLTANPAVAYEALLEHRRQASRVGVAALAMGARRGRAAISAAKAPMLAAVQRVLTEQREFWPLSDRMIHYRLLNDPPLRHASKHLKYRNDYASYHDLCNLLTRARLAGIVPMEAIADATRPVTTWRTWPDVGAYLRDETKDLFRGFWRNLQQSQPNHIELLIEKNTMVPILRPVAERFCIPLTSARGFSSIPPRYGMAQRFRGTGKDKLVVLLVTDFDPDGMCIAESFGRSLRDDFGVSNVHPIRVALNAEHVAQFHLPPGGKAKAGSVNRKDFVSRYGDDVFELEALRPVDLQQVLTAAIEAVTDRAMLNREIDAEKADAATLTAWRQVALDALGGLTE